MCSLCKFCLSLLDYIELGQSNTWMWFVRELVTTTQHGRLECYHGSSGLFFPSLAFFPSKTRDRCAWGCKEECWETITGDCEELLTTGVMKESTVSPPPCFRTEIRMLIINTYRHPGQINVFIKTAASDGKNKPDRTVGKDTRQSTPGAAREQWWSTKRGRKRKHNER